MKKNLKWVCFPFLMVATGFSAYAENSKAPNEKPGNKKRYEARHTAENVNKTITGKIRDDEGKGVAGATVMVKGGSTVTTTDADGGFSLSVPDNATTLVISSAEFQTQEISIANRNSVMVVLQRKGATLTDVVVVGYGVQKKSDLTGSVSSIKGSDLTQLPVPRADQALQGRAAGVFVQNTDGAPGGNASIRIRGFNSINGSNRALIVIDGLQGANLATINPSDIESIEVLKDASATAIYGARGANGVVLVTTKRGKTGKPMLNYNYSYGMQKVNNRLELMNAGDYARTVNDYIATLNSTGPQPPMFSAAEISDYDKNGGTDWQDVLFRTGALQNHQLSINGGNENVKYLLSGGYLSQEGVVVNSSYKRYTLRANVEANANSWITLGLNWFGSKEDGNVPVFGNSNGNVSWLGVPIGVALRWAPTATPYDANGNYSIHPPNYGASDTWNPLASALEPYIRNSTISNLVTGYADFKIINGLKLRLSSGASIFNTNNLNFYNLKTFQGVSNNGYGELSTDFTRRFQNSAMLTYNKEIKNHNITVMGVAEQVFERGDANSLVARDFTVEQTKIYDLAGAKDVVNSSGSSERVIRSFLGRLNYSYAGKYLLTGSVRADGSSVFGANNKWGYFPSVSAAWRASEETFIRNLNFFSDLKIRASWGKTGNQAIAPYQTYGSVASGSNYPYNGNDNTDIGFVIASPSNPDLKWETTTQTNIGIDFALFNGRFTVTADYYKKTTRDLLLSRLLPTYTGFTSITDNIGAIENSGFELAIGADPIVGTVRWNTGFTISTNKNKVLDIGDNPFLSFRTTQGGYGVGRILYLKKDEPYGQMYGIGTEGTWGTKDAAAAAVYGQLPGDRKYTDVNKDGKITNADLKVIGNAIPDYILGWSNRISYKDFDLNFLFQGSIGNDLFNMNRIRLEAEWEGTSKRLLDRWTVNNQNTDIPAFIDEQTRIDANLTSTVNFTGPNQISHFVEDASYVRLKNVTFSYNLPKSLLSRLKITKARAYISGLNLLTFTNYTGMDPESSSYTNRDYNLGIDWGNYPSVKMFSFGLDITL